MGHADQPCMRKMSAPNANLRATCEVLGAFRYQDRVIAWSERAVELHGRKMRLLLFWDTKLEGEQKQMWLDRYERGELSKQNVEERFVQCGKIALLTNTSFPAEEVYLLYKSRASIGECIRRFKDALNMEGTDMRDDQALAGYFFVLSLAMRCHYLLMQKLRDAKLLKHYSVRDAIWELRKIRKEPWIKGWHFRPLTRRQKTLIEKLGLSLAPRD